MVLDGAVHRDYTPIERRHIGVQLPVHKMHILNGPTADVHDIDTELLDDLSGKSQKDGICD